MTKRRDRYRKLFDTLRAYEASGAEFTIADLSTATGHKPSSLAVYFRNRLKNVYVFTKDGVAYSTKGLRSLRYDRFFDYMSQKSEKIRRLEY